MGKASKSLVIVESPTKAKTIRKFLGKDYIVESCMGHIRDLPQSAKDIPEKFKKEKWASLGVNPDKDFEPIYCIPKNKTKIVSELKSKLKDADELILATDEDREGESISWHLLEVLNPKVPVKRMVFHEITKPAIEKALKNFRDIDKNLVKAQEARRILDRLVGYTISPLVWKKIAYGLSAGRVQSVAVKLICEREMQRFIFKRSSYWDLSAKLKKGSQGFDAKISVTKGKRVASGKDFDGLTGELHKKSDVILLDEKQARALAKDLQAQDWKVTEVEESPFTRKPYPPFITSSLQQEANRKLNLGARDTMRAAQSLYEKGFITYMRTDSTFLSQQAIDAARNGIKELYGKDYMPIEPRLYNAKKAKGAQEAHEAIRPAGDAWVTPEDSGLRDLEFKLYDMIWKRTMASQMSDAKQTRVGVKIEAGNSIFNASGMTIEFPGFLRAYVEGSDDADAALEDREVNLPKMSKGDSLKCDAVEPKDHETKPPARFTEASLIQTMEKEGIGRPSTYAPTIATIQERGYVRKDANALVPTFTALVLTKLLSKYFPEYVDTSFTSGMEQSLDEVADGDLDSIDYLGKIYLGKGGLRALVEKQEKNIDADEARSLSMQDLDKYSIRVGRYGAYVCRMDGKEEMCASLPDSLAPADMTSAAIERLIDQKIKGADAFCLDEKSGLPIYILSGRYGPYVQLGDVSSEDAKPKRVSIPPTIKPEEVTPEIAKFLIELPKKLGVHPETKKDVSVGLGRFGPFILHDGDFRSITKAYSIFTMDFKTALEILSQPKKGRGGAAKIIKDLGKDPNGKESIQILDGKYGPYIKWGKKNVSIPENKKAEEVDAATAWVLIGDKFDTGAATSADKPAKKKASAKKVKAPAKNKIEVVEVAPAPAKKKVITKKKAK
jgi:DNA topoisomerase-1